MKYRNIFSPLLVLMFAFIGQSASAALTEFTSRAAWLAAVGPVLTEDFELNTGGFTPVLTPFVTAKGFALTGINNQITMQILPVGQLTVLDNGTQFLHFRDFTGGLRMALPFNSSAFGFDYGASESGWALSAANGVSFAFPSGPNSQGFIGYIETGGTPFQSFTMIGPAGAQGGLSIDNISVPVPEPATVVTFSVGLIALLSIAGRQRKGLTQPWPL